MLLLLEHGPSLASRPYRVEAHQGAMWEEITGCEGGRHLKTQPRSKAWSAGVGSAGVGFRGRLWRALAASRLLPASFFVHEPHVGARAQCVRGGQSALDVALNAHRSRCLVVHAAAAASTTASPTPTTDRAPIADANHAISRSSSHMVVFMRSLTPVHLPGQNGACAIWFHQHVKVVL